jgi:putative transposase
MMIQVIYDRNNARSGTFSNSHFWYNLRIPETCEWRDLEIVEGNVQIDHVHLILWIPPKYSVSEAVGFLKGKSAIKMFDRHPELKRRYWGRHFWAKGYCVSTVGLNEEQIRKYVRWQLKKDKDMDQLSLLK